MDSPELGHKHIYDADGIYRILTGGKSRWEQVLESLGYIPQAIRQHPWRTISIASSVISSFVGWDLLHERNIPRTLGLEKNQTMVGVQLPDLIQSRQIALAEFTTTPKPEPSLTPTLPTLTPSPETTAAPAKATNGPPEEPREFPRRIEVGHFGEYTKGIELQEAAQFIENGTSEKPLLNLKISDPTSILWATGSISRGTISAIESSKPISAFSLFDNCQVFSDTEFGILLNRGGLNKPIIVVTTPEELAKMDPKMSPNFEVVIPGTGDIMFREIVITPIRASLPKTKWLKMPGEIVNRGEDFVSIEAGQFVFSYTDHFKNGTRVTKGHLTDFAQIQNQPIYLNP